MKEIIKFKSIKTRLTFWFLLVALLPLITVSIIISQRTRVIKENEFHKLTAVRDLKAREINNWIDERIGDIKLLKRHGGVITAASELKKGSIVSVYLPAASAKEPDLQRSEGNPATRNEESILGEG